MAVRRENKFLQERVLLPYDHAQATADVTTKLWAVPSGRSFRLDRVWYNNPTGLAADAANYFNVIVQKGSITMANWSTETGQEGALSADTPVELAKSATDADLVADGGDVISLKLDETGTQTLPAGRLVIEGRLL